MAICDAAAAEIGAPVRGAEALWSCVEAMRAAGNGDFAAGMATERALFSRVSRRALPCLALPLPCLALLLPYLALPSTCCALICVLLFCFVLPCLPLL